MKFVRGYAHRVLGPIRIRSVLAIILLAVGIWYVWLQVRIGSFGDFRVYLAGANALLDGDALYDLQVQGARRQLPFTYPPFAAALFIPFTLVSQALGSYLWSIISFGCLFAIAWMTAARIPALAGYLAKTRTWELAALILALSVFSETIIKNFQLGQVNIVVVCAVLFDTVSRTRYRGFLTGLAAGFKVTPAIFIVFMLVNRRWADFGRAMLGFATSLVIGSFFGVSQVWQYWTTELLDTNRVGDTDRNSNVSALGTLTRLLPEPTAKAVWLAAVVIVGIAAFWIAAKWWDHSRLVAASVIGVTGLFVTPISWVHHWVWLIPAGGAAVALTIRAFRERQRLVGIVMAGAGFLAIVPEVLHMRYRGGALVADHPKLSDLVGAGYPIVAALVIAAFGIGLTLRDSSQAGELEPPASASDGIELPDEASSTST